MGTTDEDELVKKKAVLSVIGTHTRMTSKNLAWGTAALIRAGAAAVRRYCGLASSSTLWPADPDIMAPTTPECHACRYSSVESNGQRLKCCGSLDRNVLLSIASSSLHAPLNMIQTNLVVPKTRCRTVESVPDAQILPQDSKSVTASTLKPLVCFRPNKF